MFRFALFVLATATAIFSIYKSHHLASYIYFNYCNGVALGSPACMYVLDFMRLGAQSVQNFWVYAATVVSGVFLYAFNRLFSELSGIQKRLNVNESDIHRFRNPVQPQPAN